MRIFFYSRPLASIRGFLPLFPYLSSFAVRQDGGLGPEDAGRQARHLPKMASEGALVAESGRVGNVGNAPSRRRQEVKRFVDPDFHDQFLRRQVEDPLHEPGKVMGRETANRRQLLDAWRIGDSFLDLLQRRRQFAKTTRLNAARGGLDVP